VPTPEEYWAEAEACLKLSGETEHVYAKEALRELAEHYLAMAEQTFQAPARPRRTPARSP
jgi:hypothetical protein